MMWKLEYSEKAKRQLKKLNKHVAAHITSWLSEHIDGTENPRATGKGLTANRSGVWRYRVGDYRILCELHDNVVTVEVVTIAHRSKVYKA